MATPLTAPGASGTQQQQIPEPVQQQSTRNLQDIYSELDRIRAQQTALAQDHVNLSHLQAEGLSLADMVGLDSAKYQRNNEKFAKKEADVSALMDKNLTTEDDEGEAEDIADLIARCQHHKGAAKKDAVVALRQHLASNAERLGRELGVVVEALAPLVVDEDSDVRKAVRHFQETLVERVPKETVRAAANLLLLYVVSAMTHIDEDIRADSLAFIRLWLEHGLLDRGVQRDKMFRNLVSLMAKDSKLFHGAALTSRMISPKLKLEMLTCFYLAIQRRDGKHGSSSLETTRTLAWPSSHGPVLLAATSASANALSEHRHDEVDSGIADNVWPFLVDTWIESLPEATNPTTPKGAIRYQTLVKILRVMETVWSSVFGSSDGSKALQTKFWETIQRHVIGEFPFGSKSSSKESPVWRELNVAMCDLITTISEISDDPAVFAAFQSAANYLHGTLFGEVTSWTNVNASVRGLLRILRRSLLLATPSVSTSLLKTFVSAQKEIHYTLASRIEATRFLASLIREESIFSAAAPDLWVEFRTWILSLPALLWQLRMSDMDEVSSIVADALTRSVREAIRLQHGDADFMNALEKAFVPLFLATVPGKGDILGPFTIYREDIQRNVASVLFVEGAPQERLCKAVAACCNIPTISLSVSDFFLDLFEGSVADGNASKGTYLSFMLSLVLGYMTSETKAFPGRQDMPELLDPAVGLKSKVQLCERSGYVPNNTRQGDAITRLFNMSADGYVARRKEVAKLIINHLGRMTAMTRCKVFRSWKDPLENWLSCSVPADSLATCLSVLCTFELPPELVDFVITQTIRLSSYDKERHGSREASWLRECHDLCLKWISASHLDLFLTKVAEVCHQGTPFVLLSSTLDVAADLYDSGYVDLSMDLSGASQAKLELRKLQTQPRGDATETEHLYVTRAVGRLLLLMD